MVRLRRCASALALAVLAGCAAGPDYHRPALDLPAHLAPVPADSAASQAPAPPSSSASSAAGDVPAQWWRAFGSPQLDAFVTACLEHNPTLAAARAALRAAQETALAQRAAAWAPAVALSYSPTRERVADAVASPVSNNADYYTLHTAQVSVSYSADVFGAARRGLESAQAQVALQRDQQIAADLSLSANAVAAALTEASLRAQRAAALAIVADQQVLLDHARRQRAAGQAADNDVTLQLAALAAAQNALPPLDKQLAAERDLLAALAGRYAADGVAQTFELDALTPPAELPTTLPSRLIEHRPDVLAAEAELQAASADIGMAVAARLPEVTLGVNAYGSSAYALSDLFKASTMFWTLAGSVTQPLFDGGALAHRAAAARAVFEQASAQYKATVLAAFQQVADVLQALQADDEALRVAAAAEAAGAASLARARQQAALGDIGTDAVLALQQNQAQAVGALAQARSGRLSDVAALFQALGGGWWNEAQHADARPAATTH